MPPNHARKIAAQLGLTMLPRTFPAPAELELGPPLNPACPCAAPACPTCPTCACPPPECIPPRRNDAQAHNTPTSRQRRKRSGEVIEQIPLRRRQGIHLCILANYRKVTPLT